MSHAQPDPPPPDVLSEVLDALHVASVLYFRAQLRAPFGVRVPTHPDVARFHVCLAGECHVGLADGSQGRRVQAGDLVVVPRGLAHVIADRPDRARIPLDDVLAEHPPRDHVLRYGGDGTTTEIVCGHFEFERAVLHPLLDAMPPLLHFPAAPARDFRWIDGAMRLHGAHARLDSPGGAVAARRLAELLFIQVLRAWADAEGERAGALAAIRDPHLGRALERFHAQPGGRWSVASLARAAGMSRTVFAERFHRMVGIAPMQYVTGWRMQRAKHALRTRSLGIAEVAEAVGYHSEAAFSRAFKKAVGVPPAAFRSGRRRPCPHPIDTH